MKLNKVKLFAIGIIALPLLAMAVFKTSPVGAVSNAASKFDAAADYKKQCTTCHKAKAEKFFDGSKTDDALIETILKGKKAAKPPHMPGYEAKGMTKDKAKLLVDHMRKLKTPS